jgi:4'-phosphopantetheinyl transferase superfamily
VLTAAERDTLGHRDCLSDVSIDDEVLLRFSLKESAYKALHKYVNRYVQFAEAEVYPCGNRDGGTADIKLLLNSNDNDAVVSDNSIKSVYKIDAHWRRLCIQLQPQPTAAAAASDVQRDTVVDEAAVHVSADTAAVAVAVPTEDFHVFLTCANVQKL